MFSIINVSSISSISLEDIVKLSYGFVTVLGVGKFGRCRNIEQINFHTDSDDKSSQSKNDFKRTSFGFFSL